MNLRRNRLRYWSGWWRRDLLLLRFRCMRMPWAFGRGVAPHCWNLFRELDFECLGSLVFGKPCVLLDGNLTVRVADAGKSWFVWKKLRVEATVERVGELERFVSELKMLLEARA